MIKICKNCGKEFETDNYAKNYCSQNCATAGTKANMRPKRCVICGQEFIPKSGVATICEREHTANCEICGKEFVLTKDMFHRGVTTCSRACSKEKTRRMYIEKYGVDHPMKNKEVREHFEQAMLNKYGVKSPLQSEEIRTKAKMSNNAKFGVDWVTASKEMHDKARQTMLMKYGGETTLQSEVLSNKVKATCIERFGVPNAMMTDSVRFKSTLTNIERYGVTNPAQNPDIHAKMDETRRTNNDGQYWTDDMTSKSKATWLTKYGVDNPSKSPEIIQKIQDTMIDKYGVDWGTQLSKSNKHKLSKINQQFGKVLKHKLDLDVEYEFPLGGKIFDILIQDTNILIEIDPSYTHNAIGNHWNADGMDKDYHISKSKIASDNGYRCIHIFDWDDWDKILMLLEPKKTIYARKCKIYKLNRDVTDEFLNSYHLQGTVKGQVLRLGLVYNDELVQVMTFGKPRYDKSASIELLRLCSRPDVRVVGGSERLFRFAVDKMYARNIISYCDLSKFNGEVYARLGMTLVRQTDPQEIWSKGDKKITANLLRQRGYDQLFGTNFGKGVSNEKLMIEDGWLPVYDCGQSVYKLT